VRTIPNTEVLPGDRLLVVHRRRPAVAHVAGVSNIVGKPHLYRLIVVSQGEVHRIDLPHDTPVRLLKGGRWLKATRQVRVDRRAAALQLSDISPVRIRRFG
jgi:hypothetical protein